MPLEHSLEWLLERAVNVPIQRGHCIGCRTKKATLYEVECPARTYCTQQCQSLFHGYLLPFGMKRAYEATKRKPRQASQIVITEGESTEIVPLSTIPDEILYLILDLAFVERERDEAVYRLMLRQMEVSQRDARLITMMIANMEKLPLIIVKEVDLSILLERHPKLRELEIPVTATTPTRLPLLPNMKVLSLIGSGVTMITLFISKCPHLKSLSVVYTKIPGEFFRTHQLGYLTTLMLPSKTQLTADDMALMPNIHTLGLMPDSLANLEILATLPKLEHLTLSVYKIAPTTIFKNLSQLKTLEVSRGLEEEDLGEVLGSLINLTSLSLSEMDEIHIGTLFKKLDQLRKLLLDSIALEVGDFALLPRSLESLDIFEVEGLVDNPMAKLPNLKNFKYRSHISRFIINEDNHANFLQVTDLNLIDCEIQPLILRRFTQLEELILSKKTGDVVDEDLALLVNLKTLRIPQCRQFTDNALFNLTNLKELNIASLPYITAHVDYWKKITDASISRLVNLEILNISGRGNITSDGLQPLVRLRTLDAHNIKPIYIEGSDLSGLTTLIELVATDTHISSDSIRPLQHLQKLQVDEWLQALVEPELPNLYKNLREQQKKMDHES